MKCLNTLHLVAVLGIGTLLGGCATFSGAENNKNLNKLKYGMSETQVLNLLGTPDSIVKQNSSDDRWIYEFRREDKAGHNLYVDFKNDALTKTGELNGREIAAEEPNRESGICAKHVNVQVMQDSLCIK